MCDANTRNVIRGIPIVGPLIVPPDPVIPEINVPEPQRRQLPAPTAERLRIGRRARISGRLSRRRRGLESLRIPISNVPGQGAGTSGGANTANVPR